MGCAELAIGSRPLVQKGNIMAVYNFEQQMVETIAIVTNRLNQANIRFTIAPHHYYSGVIFRFPDDPGKGDFFVAPYSQVHYLERGQEDFLEAESIRFPWDGDEGDVTTFYLPEDLEDLLAKIIEYLG